MPPQVNFSRDTILNEAFELVRKEGLQALTARNIAQHLKSSTQPIYSAFRSIKELETTVIEKTKAYATTYLLTQEKEEEPFFNIGLRYLRFAKEEQELFKLLFMSGRFVVELEQPLPFFTAFLERIRQDDHLQGLDDSSLHRIFSNMWIFAHGLATLMCVGTVEYSDEFIRNKLHQAGTAMIRWEHHRNNTPIEWQDDQEELV